MKFYYECHVRYDANDGYSAFFETDKKLDSQEDIIQHAVMLEEIQPDHAVFVDYAVGITKDEYLRGIEGNDAADAVSSDDIVDFDIIVKVKYNCNGVSRKKLEEMLYAMLDHCAGEGLFTCDTEATVAEWSSSVTPVQ